MGNKNTGNTEIKGEGKGPDQIDHPKYKYEYRVQYVCTSKSQGVTQKRCNRQEGHRRLRSKVLNVILIIR